MSRFTRTGRDPSTDAGLLRSALQQDERNRKEDDADDDDLTFT
jgi:hypothetical protein